MHLPFRAPGGDRTFNAAMFLGIGLWFFVSGILSGDGVGRVMGGAILVLGVGLWVRYSWARWPAAVSLLALVAFNLFMMLSKKFSWFSLVANLWTLWIAWCVIRDQGEKKVEETPPQTEDRPLVSI